MKHHIERTSPKGEKFVGTCRLCGQRNLSMADAQKDCPNVRGLTKAEALSEALNGNWKRGASDCADAGAPAREIWVAQSGFDFEIFTVVNSSGVSIACLVDGVSSAAGLPRLSSEEARQLAAMLEKSATELDNL